MGVFFVQHFGQHLLFLNVLNVVQTRRQLGGGNKVFSPPASGIVAF